MKKLKCYAVLLGVSILPVMRCQSATEPNFVKIDSSEIPAQIAAYGKSSNQILFQKEHLYVFNGMSSVGLNPKHFGIHRLVSPPYIANPFSADLELFGQKVKVNDYQWYPSECLFRGQAINGVESRLRVVPLKSHRGALVTLILLNTGAKPVTVPLKWDIQGWGGMLPRWDFAARSSPNDGSTSIKNNSLVKESGNAKLVASFSGISAKVDHNSLSEEISLASGKAVKHSLLIVFGDKKKVNVALAKTLSAHPERLIAETRNYWSGLFSMAEKRMPELTGASPELQAFYRAGVMSFLSTRFEIPELLFNPFYVTSGIDGGAMNCYLWDTSYTSFTGGMLAPKNMRDKIAHFLKLDIRTCYAFDPLKGKPQGPCYAYNYYNLARLVYTYLAITGDYGLMEEDINGKPVFTRLYESCLSFEDMSKAPTLLDYGGNHNLLELKRTKNYTHVTPSPNAERVLTYRYLTEIYQALGRKTPHDLTGRGEALKKLFVAKLWNKEKQWLNTLDKHGNPRTAYSVQIFDVLRTGMLNEKQERGILNHLNEKEFLSKWGLHSLAKTDPGYDKRDVDWGGPGTYTGDPTELVVDLCQAGYAEEGVDLLKRILWWGELPYLPQAMRANRKGYREDGRSNVIAGGATCHAVINGLFGVEPGLDGITITPIKHPMMEGLSLKGVRIRKREFDISVKNDTFTVTVDGKKTTKTLGEEVVISH